MADCDHDFQLTSSTTTRTGTEVQIYTCSKCGETRSVTL